MNWFYADKEILEFNVIQIACPFPLAKDEDTIDEPIEPIRKSHPIRLRAFARSG
jgi:hypothetical protein